MYYKTKSNIITAIIVALLLLVTGIGINSMVYGTCDEITGTPTLPQLVVAFGIINLVMVIIMFIGRKTLTKDQYKSSKILTWLVLLWIILMIAWYITLLVQLPSQTDCFRSDPAFYAVIVAALGMPLFANLRGM